MKTNIETWRKMQGKIESSFWNRFKNLDKVSIVNRWSE